MNAPRNPIPTTAAAVITARAHARRSRRLGRAVLFATFAPSLLSSILLTGGCDDPDERNDKLLNKAMSLESKSPQATPPTDRVNQIQARLAAKDNKNLSDLTKYGQRLALAQAETDAGDQLARAAENDEIEAARLVGQIYALNAQVEVNTVQITALMAMDPVAARKSISDLQAAAKGSGENATWGPEDKPVPSQAALDARIAKLNEQAKALQDERASKEADRKAKSDDADRLEEQAAKATGKSGVELGTAAAGVRKTSRELSSRIEAIDLDLSRVQQDLKVAASRKASVEKVADLFKGQADRIEAEWKTVQEQIDLQKAATRKLVGGGEGTPPAANAVTPRPPVPPAAPPPPEGSTMFPDATPAPAAGPTTRKIVGRDFVKNPLKPEEIEKLAAGNSIAEKAKQLHALVAAADQKRKDALDWYEKAQVDVKLAASTAVSAAAAAKKRAGDGPGGPADQATAKVLNNLLAPGDFDLEQAMILLKIGRVKGDQANGLATRDELRSRVSETLAKANLTVPEALAEPEPPEAHVARTAFADAEKAYQDADALLQPLTTGAGSDRAIAIAKSAATAQVAEKYARAQYLFRARDDAKAKSALAEAKGILKEVASSQKPDEDIPAYLPPDLLLSIGRQPKASATTAPSTPPKPGTPGTPTTPAVATTPAPAPSTVGPAVPDNADQAAARAVAVEFFTAIVAGDADKARGLAGGTDPTFEEQTNTAVALLNSTKKMVAAMTAKFPDKAAGLGAPATAMFASAVDVAKRGPIVIAGETAKVMDPGQPEELVVLKKFDGQWKIDPSPNPDPAKAQKDAAMTEKMKTVVTSIDQFSDDVTAGKYATFEEAQAALGAATAGLGGGPEAPAPAAPAPAAPAPGPAAPATPPAPEAGCEKDEETWVMRKRWPVPIGDA